MNIFADAISKRFSQNETGVETNRTNSIQSDLCLLRNQPGEHSMTFTDSVSLDEYRITGMCQTCQDSHYEEMRKLFED